MKSRWLMTALLLAAVVSLSACGRTAEAERMNEMKQGARATEENDISKENEENRLTEEKAANEDEKQEVQEEKSNNEDMNSTKGNPISVSVSNSEEIEDKELVEPIYDISEKDKVKDITSLPHDEYVKLVSELKTVPDSSITYVSVDGYGDACGMGFPFPKYSVGVRANPIEGYRYAGCESDTIEFYEYEWNEYLGYDVPWFLVPDSGEHIIYVYYEPTNEEPKQETEEQVTINEDVPLTQDDEVYLLSKKYTYDGEIKDITLRDDGDYNITWSNLNAYATKTLPAEEVETFYIGMEYQFGNDTYHCVESTTYVEDDYWYFVEDYYDNLEEVYDAGGCIYRVEKNATDGSAVVEFVDLVATSSFLPAHVSEVYENVTTILAANAIIEYLSEDYSHVRIPFEEYYNSEQKSIYARPNGNERWRGFYRNSIHKIQDGKATILKEMELMG